MIRAVTALTGINYVVASPILRPTCVRYYEYSVRFMSMECKGWHRLHSTVPRLDQLQRERHAAAAVVVDDRSRAVGIMGTTTGT